MPELPEITVLARQLSQTVQGKKIKNIVARQPKNLNISVPEFKRKTIHRTLGKTYPKGKWLITPLNDDALLLTNLGMGAEMFYLASGQNPSGKYQFLMRFHDGSGYTIHFWWFGKIHLVKATHLYRHKELSALGPHALDSELTEEKFLRMLEGRRGAVKPFLMNQKNIAGIGNVYIQEILFRVGLHPKTPIPALSKRQKTELFHAIQDVLQESIDAGGLSFEQDFFGTRGGYNMDRLGVGYKEGKKCPNCGTAVEKIKTGSTSHFICPNCQRLKGVT